MCWGPRARLKAKLCLDWRLAVRKSGQLSTKAIILNRLDYGEADRILTMLTPDQGKLRVMARGVRREKSKLAGGIELFSVSDITFIRGRGEIATLTSTRLDKYWGNIVQDLDRTMYGFDILKLFGKATEDEPEEAYFNLLRKTLEALDDSGISLRVVKFWCSAQLLKLSGHGPNLKKDTSGKQLEQSNNYTFDFDQMAFTPSDSGSYGSEQIKFLRLVFDDHTAKALAKVQGSEELTKAAAPLVETMLHTYLRV